MKAKKLKTKLRVFVLHIPIQISVYKDGKEETITAMSLAAIDHLKKTLLDTIKKEYPLYSVASIEIGEKELWEPNKKYEEHLSFAS